MKSERLTYNKFTAKDKVHCASWYTDQQVMRYIKGRAMTIIEAENRFNEIIQINQDNVITGFYGVYFKSEFIGIAKMVHLTPTELEVGYGLLTPFWGQGYASEILNAMIETSNTIDRITLLTGIVNKENHASIALLKKHGFKLITQKEESDFTHCYFSRKP